MKPQSVLPEAAGPQGFVTGSLLSASAQKKKWAAPYVITSSEMSDAETGGANFSDGVATHS